MWGECSHQQEQVNEASRGRRRCEAATSQIDDITSRYASATPTPTMAVRIIAIRGDAPRARPKRPMVSGGRAAMNFAPVRLESRPDLTSSRSITPLAKSKNAIPRTTTGSITVGSPLVGQRSIREAVRLALKRGYEGLARSRATRTEFARDDLLQPASATSSPS